MYFIYTWIFDCSSLLQPNRERLVADRQHPPRAGVAGDLSGLAADASQRFGGRPRALPEPRHCHAERPASGNPARDVSRRRQAIGTAPGRCNRLGTAGARHRARARPAERAPWSEATPSRPLRRKRLRATGSARQAIAGDDATWRGSARTRWWHGRGLVENRGPGCGFRFAWRRHRRDAQLTEPVHPAGAVSEAASGPPERQHQA